MSGWAGLVAAATVGARGRTIRTDGFEPSVAAAAAHLEGVDNAALVLRLAALATVAARAGAQPGTGATPIACAPADPRLMMSERLSGLLVRALDHGERVGDWALTQIAASGLRASPATMLMLLTRAKRTTASRVAVDTLVGARGHWLATVAGLQPPATAAVHDATAWTHGTIAQRTATLLQLRRGDAEHGRTLLESTWRSESAPDRAQLLDALVVGLSLADEPFLEAALDDRSQQVSAVARIQLARLPDSRFGRRMAQRAVGLLVAQRKLTGLRVRAELPAELDDGARRDGLTTTADTGGQRARWFTQIVSTAPLRMWPDALRASPQRIVDAVAKDDAPLIIPALAAAAVTQCDADWAWALRRQPRASLEVIGALDPERQAIAVAEQLAFDPSGAVLRLLSGPMPSAVARQAVAILVAATRAPMPANTLGHWRDFVAEFGVRAPVSVADELPTGDRIHQSWHQLYDDLVTVLSIRRSIIEELP